MARKSNLAVEISASEETQPGEKPQSIFINAQPGTHLVTNMQINEEIAKSAYVIRNITFPKAIDAFPHQPKFRTIERYYPLAEGGPLYVDNVLDKTDKEEMDACEVKRRFMKSAKLRYLVVVKDVTDMISVAEQLEG